MTSILPRTPRQKALVVAAAFGLTMMIAGPAATETTAIDTSNPSEVQRFCSNIADAARDRRYALQAKELRDLQTEIDKRIATLEERRAEYESWLKRREDFLDKTEDNIVQIYGRMKPDAAAERLAQLQVELAAGILLKLDSRKAGVILNEMDSKAAAALTTIMVSATRRVDPT